MNDIKNVYKNNESGLEYFYINLAYDVTCASDMSPVIIYTSIGTSDATWYVLDVTEFYNKFTLVVTEAE